MDLTDVGVLPKHVKNLRILADHLATLPAEYESFSMANYVYQNAADDAGPHELSTIPCNTVACSIGHGPSAGIPVGDCESWYEYIKENLCLPKTLACDWLFSSNWTFVDNTPQGAAARIKYLLEHGLPDDYQAMQVGKLKYPWEVS